MKKVYLVTGLDAALVAFCLFWVAHHVREETYWYLLLWGPLLGWNVMCLRRDIRRLRAARAPVLLPPTPDEQRLADVVRFADVVLTKGVEPVETPNEGWLERHMKECSMCRKFQEGE